MTVRAFIKGNNAELVAEVAKLGYLDGRVMDPTWGEGNFWTVFRPKRLVRHDLYTFDGLDVRDLHYKHRRATFDAIVLDLPYAFRGKATPAFDDKYGVDEYRSANAIMKLIFDAMSSCEPLLRPEKYLLVKCQDQVVSGNIRWQTDEITAHAKSLWLRKVDRFDLDGGGREQPEGRTKKCPTCKGYGVLGWTWPSSPAPACPDCQGTGKVPSKQQHAGFRPSTLLVFQKKKSTRAACAVANLRYSTLNS